MTYRIRILLLFLFCFINPCVEAVCAGVSPVGDEIRKRLELNATPVNIPTFGDTIHASIALPSFYIQRVFRPAFVTPDGGISRAGRQLIDAILDAEADGLNPEDYHLEAITETRRCLSSSKKNETPGLLADLDMLMTDAYMIYGSHLLMGRINPETIDPEWIANRRNADFSAVLQGALEKNDIKGSLKYLMPDHYGYTRLKKALAQYRSIAERGGWSQVHANRVLKKGVSGPAVEALKKRLITTGDLESSGPGMSLAVFDEALEQAVTAFQTRCGLEPDGIVGRRTLAALNTPVEARIRQITLNLERWRWLPENLGERYILINIADYNLEIIENGCQVMDMRLVVGKPYRRTPVFSQNMTYLVFSPYWHVPPGIAQSDILPKIKADPAYLFRNRMTLLQGRGADERIVDPFGVDWSKTSLSHFPFHIRQEPGGTNPLGKVKFMFPNKFNVYLHDTSAPELFEKTSRTFSSGCIRVQKPFEMAVYLLKEAAGWDSEKIRSAMDRNIEQMVRLPRPIPVHVQYMTAWVDAEGAVQFRPDIYGRDRRLAGALKQEPPSE
jgi:murein L,D-transpeptidase YcbB/YkuD